MVPCTPPEHSRRPAVAADILRAIAALFFACLACGPALAAQFDPSIPEPRLLPAESDKAANPVPVWHSRYAVEEGTQPRQAPPPQHRHPQPRRSSTASGIKQADYQRDYQRDYQQRDYQQRDYQQREYQQREYQRDYQPAYRSGRRVDSYRTAQRTAPPQNGPTFSGAAVWDDEPPVASSGPVVAGEEMYQSCGDCGNGGCGCGDCDCGDCGDCCEDDGCPPCDDGYDLIAFDLPFADRLWARGEYLLWYTRAGSLPPLVTTSPVGTARDVAGRLGQSTTTILLGNGVGMNSDTRSGARVELGYWLCPCQGLGFEVTYLDLGSQTSQFEADNNNFAILARPFYNLQTGSEGQDAVLVAYPGVVNGSITVTSINKFQTLEGLLRRHLTQECGRTIDFLAGYRYAYLQDTLTIDDTTTSIQRDSPVPFGTTISSLDQFDAKNRFNGGEVGIVFQQRYRRWTLDLLMKLALGSTQSQVDIAGSTSTTPRGSGTTSRPGGILALPTNIGVYDQTKLSLMPELNLTLGYDVTRHLRATVGYNFIYWSNVARPGDQINTDLNASQFPPGTLSGAARPNFVFHTTDFWAQGLNVGLEYRF